MELVQGISGQRIPDLPTNSGHGEIMQSIIQNLLMDYEYIENGIGVIRSQSNGELISIVSRMGTNFDKLQFLVEKKYGNLDEVILE